MEMVMKRQHQIETTEKEIFAVGSMFVALAQRIGLKNQMKKLLVAGVSAACIFSTNPASAGSLHQIFFRHLDIPQGQSLSVTLIDDPNEQILCALTGVGGHFDGGGEHGAVLKVNGVWLLSGSSGQPGVFFEATCWQLIL